MCACHVHTLFSQRSSLLYCYTACHLSKNLVIVAVYLLTATSTVPLDYPNLSTFCTQRLSWLARKRKLHLVLSRRLNFKKMNRRRPPLNHLPRKMPNNAIRYDRTRIKKRRIRHKPKIIRKYWQPGVILKICCRDGDDDRPLSFCHRDQDNRRCYCRILMVMMTRTMTTKQKVCWIASTTKHLLLSTVLDKHFPIQVFRNTPF